MTRFVLVYLFALTAACSGDGTVQFGNTQGAGGQGGSGDGGNGGFGGSGGSGVATGGGGGGEPQVVCTSNTYWTNGDLKSPSMHPGRACQACHVTGGKASSKSFDVSGTVYPTAHEPDDCNGITGAQVIITDGNGQDHALTVNAVGNFYHQDFFGFQAFPKPLKAKVVYNGKERVMTAAQMTGDCNSCHTVAGANMAPGRIMMP